LALPVTEETLPDFLAHMETDPCPRPQDPSCSTTPCGECDADGKGEPDIAELRKDENPNDASRIVCPKYGCDARVAPPPRRKRSLDGAALLVALAGAGTLARRRSSTAGSAG